MAQDDWLVGEKTGAGRKIFRHPDLRGVVISCMKTIHRIAGVCLFGVITTALLAGCAGSPPWGGWSKEPSDAQVQAALGHRESYIYFTHYEVYRRTRAKEYVYREHGAWVHRDVPPAGVSEAALEASPSVEVALNDTPENQHSAVKLAYPRNLDASSIVAASP